jgi:multidrug efflux pump subunit AcrA (membrane-fusion protein)
MFTKTIPLLLIASSVSATELTHDFISPAFSGQGWSQHVLTIEQLESQRRQKIKDDEDAAEAKAQLAARQTNLAKFLVNVESRIYAQLSKQLADELFAEGGANSGEMNFQGTHISWMKTGTDVTLTILENNGNRTEVTVPISGFSF